MKGAGLTVVVALALMAALIALFYWSPWREPSETDWLQSYEAWSEGVEARLAAGETVTRASCEATFDEEVGEPPGEFVDGAAEAARRGCAEHLGDDWGPAELDVVRALRDAHATHEVVAPAPRRQPDFAERASTVAGRPVEVYCWPAERWSPFVQQYAVVRGDDELSLKGIADPAAHRIDLEPGVCASLRRYVRGLRPLELSFENFALAEAIVVLTHQAEHFRLPSASEGELECFAVQHVRPFIRAAGWGPDYETEIALHAWDLGYTQLPPQVRAPGCRDGGPLDRHPASSAWP